ncbi:MAG TPA: DUF5916 domain-containing protein [Longimicrobium sp.]|nr:DUF5916 domain-containing protein [Longimicrobium sp.]
MTARLPLLAALVLCPAAAAAQDGGPHAGHAPPTARVARATGPVSLDGRLDDAAWGAAEPVTAFTQVDPEEGRPASEATEARILYDDEALYVGVRLADHGRVRTRLGRRDMALGDADWVAVSIDSYHDHQTAFGFWVNPSGVRRDATRTDEGEDLSWDAVWAAEARADSGGWTAELRIPFSQLRFNPQEGSWGVQIERVIGRRNETAVFSFTPKRERAGIARYGHLEGLSGLRAGKRLELLPYTVAKTERIHREGNPFRDDVESGVSVGGDLKYRVTTDLTLDVTVNPDFGQVELDPASVNLTQFETVFAERRPFFVEGSEIFQFGPGQLPTGGGLFYTRRIGGRHSQLEPGAEEQDVPTGTGILGAAKLSGKTASGWSVGVLDAVTSREEARFIGAGGEAGELLVEPLSNFLVGRVKKDLRGGQTYVGAIATAVNRRLETDVLRAALPSAGYTGGVDFRHEFGRRAWALRGWAAGSHVRGDSAALVAVQRRPYHLFQRPDADHLDLETGLSSMSGFAGEVDLQRQAGEHWRGSVGVSTISPRFDLFDIGTQRRGDRADVEGSLTYLQQTPGRFWRYYEVSASTRREWNYDLDHIYSQTALNGFFQHLSYWSAFWNVAYAPTALDDRLTQGGPLAERPATWSGFAGFDTDARRSVVFSTEAFHQQDDGGGRITEGSVEATVQTSPRWNLTVGPYFQYARNAAQFLGAAPDSSPAALFGARYFFTGVEQRTLTLNTRFNYTFDPALTLEVVLQPFLSAVDYGEGTRYLAAPRTFRFVDDPDTEVRGDDFNVRSLRGNAVLRWEYRPGSTLFVAWQQQREDVGFGTPGVGDFDFARDRRALFDTAPDNVLVVKVSYWLNP